MAREGWVKFHRNTLDSSLWQLSTPEQKVVLIALYALANHSENEWEFAGQKFVCKPGQFVTSLDSIVKACGKGVSVKNVRTALDRFEKIGILANKSAKTGRLITLLNWDDLQGKDTATGKANGNQEANHWQTTGKEVGGKVATIKNDYLKNDKTVNKEKNASDFFSKLYAEFCQGIEPSYPADRFDVEEAYSLWLERVRDEEDPQAKSDNMSYAIFEYLKSFDEKGKKFIPKLSNILGKDYKRVIEVHLDPEQLFTEKRSQRQDDWIVKSEYSDFCEKLKSFYPVDRFNCYQAFGDWEKRVKELEEKYGSPELAVKILGHAIWNYLKFEEKSDFGNVPELSKLLSKAYDEQLGTYIDQSKMYFEE